MKTIYNCDSLNKHNITKEEVDQVYAMGKGFDLNPSLKGNDRVIVVGWTATGRLLEIGIEYLADGNEYIFHANEATKHYQNLFDRKKR